MNLLEKSKLISLLNKVLKQTGKQTSESEITYICPFHNAQNNVTRKKFGIDLDSHEYNCFACGESGKSFRTLFIKLKVKAVYHKELYSIIGLNYTPIYKKEKLRDSVLKLPDEFLSLSIPSKSIEFRHAIQYIKDRGLTREDVLRYNIGYCESGLYKNRIIIPSYDSDGNVNFFAARDYYNQSYLKYLLPGWSKNIVGFDLFINWNEPITLVEGPLDAISVRKNVIPLFGKMMSEKLKLTIIENGVSTVNVCLDNDAIKNALEICKFLNNQGIDVKLIKLEEKDASEMGFEKVNEVIKNTKMFDFSESISTRISN